MASRFEFTPYKGQAQQQGQQGSFLEQFLNSLRGTSSNGLLRSLLDLAAPTPTNPQSYRMSNEDAAFLQTISRLMGTGQGTMPRTPLEDPGVTAQAERNAVHTITPQSGRSSYAGDTGYVGRAIADIRANVGEGVDYRVAPENMSTWATPQVVQIADQSSALQDLIERSYSHGTT